MQYKIKYRLMIKPISYTNKSNISFKKSEKKKKSPYYKVAKKTIVVNTRNANYQSEHLNILRRKMPKLLFIRNSIKSRIGNSL